MALPLHKDCRARVLELLADGIGGTIAKNGMFIERSSLDGAGRADSALPKTGKLSTLLDSYIGEFPLLHFVYGTLSTELIELDAYDRNTPVKYIRDIEGYQDSKALAERLVSQFESLPWHYTFSYPIPKEIGKIFKALGKGFTLSENVRFIDPDEEFSKNYPANHENPKRQDRIFRRGLFRIPGAETWNNETVYFQFQTHGYVGLYGETNPAVEAGRLLKAILGLGIAVQLFEIADEYIPPAQSYLFVHRFINGSWKLDNRITVNEIETQLINSLRVSSFDGKLNTERELSVFAKWGLDELATVFRSGAKAELVILAAQWLFESYMGSDELVQFVRSMVVLEILLGSGDRDEDIGTGELLRNRCAYLIGTTHTQRADILRDFGNIYRVRSQIVHRGKHRLSAGERVQLRKLRWMCTRVISREIELLKAEQKKES